MDDWSQILRGSLRTPDQLACAFDLDVAEVRKISRHFKTLITPYYAGLIKTKGDPIYRQVVPDPAELVEHSGVSDPLAEDHDSPVPEHRPPLSRPPALSRLPQLRLVLPVLHPQAQGRRRRRRSIRATSRTGSTTSGPTRKSAT